MALDLPALERPAKATSAPSSGRNWAARAALVEEPDLGEQGHLGGSAGALVYNSARPESSTVLHPNFPYRTSVMHLLKLSLPTLTLMTLGVAATVLSGPALAAGTAEAGQAKAVTCSACHGMDGNSLDPEWPSLAGQHENYLVKALQSFKSGTRQNVLMSSMAMPLTDQDMADLAAYFAGQKRAGGLADPAPGQRGRAPLPGRQQGHRRACLSRVPRTDRAGRCRGWPMSIAGQHAAYISSAQLMAYRSKQRTTDGDTQMMRNVSAMLTDDDIKAVASYIQGLR